MFKKLTLQHAIEEAIKNEGKLLSKVYINNSAHLKWKCKKGHKWLATLANVRRGKWCPKCGFERSAEAKRLTIKEMCEIAKERGGKCLSSNYVNTGKHLEWMCASEHTWKATPGNVKLGTWCPKCNVYVAERMCRAYFEAIFGEKFPKSKPSWLKTGKRSSLELDGYCEKLGIAFEHQGQQHYEITRLFSKNEFNLNNIKNRDKLKRKLCEKNNVVLILIPQLGKLVKLIDLKNFIFKELKKQNIVIKHAKEIKIDVSTLYRQEDVLNFELLKNIVNSKKGKLLQTLFLGMHHIYELECEKKHVFKMTGSHIKFGRWCLLCHHHNLRSINSRPIICIETGTEYRSITEASAQLEISTSTIDKFLKNKIKNKKELTFKYK